MKIFRWIKYRLRLHRLLVKDRLVLGPIVKKEILKDRRVNNDKSKKI